MKDNRPTDADFMLSILRETPGAWVSQAELLRRSASARGCGLTPHSRAADLRSRGHHIECRVERHNGRAASFYRITTPSLPTAAVSVLDPSRMETQTLPAGIAAAESEDVLARPGGKSSMGNADGAEPEGQPSLFSLDRRPAWA